MVVMLSGGDEGGGVTIPSGCAWWRWWWRRVSCTMVSPPLTAAGSGGNRLHLHTRTDTPLPLPHRATNTITPTTIIILTTPPSRSLCLGSERGEVMTGVRRRVTLRHEANSHQLQISRYSLAMHFLAWYGYLRDKDTNFYFLLLIFSFLPLVVISASYEG